jgi:CRISPR-associated endonuclease Cas1/CRISPR-associated protein Cas4
MGNELSSELPENWATVDMVNRHTFCPRLNHLMYVEGRWEDNAHTLAGKDVHRRVDRIANLLPEAASPEEAAPEEAGDDPPVIARSVSLGCEILGLMGKLDLVSADPEGCEAVPVETKKSRVPNTPERSYPPERAQLMAQGLLLRAHGYTSTHGYIYYAGSRLRVGVEFTPELEAATRATIAAVRAGRAAQALPPPLDDSPKCWGCSLNGICLPDETRELKAEANAPPSATADHGSDPRRLYPARDYTTPLYVQEQGARVGKDSERLEIRKGDEKLGEAKVRDISQLVLMGNVQLSAQALHLLLEKEIPVIHLSTGGWFHGISHGQGVRNAYNRSAQYAAATDPARCLTFAREIVRAKIANQRILIQRNGSGPAAESALAALTAQVKEFPHLEFADLYQLLGTEGQAAGAYFSAFSTMLKTGELGDFQFTARNRRPPKDPVNALLSYCYALLAKECAVALLAEGLDPWWGFYHQARHGRPALALDLMEPFRPVVADSVVLTAINTGMLKPRDFLTNANGCALQPKGKKSLLAAWEQRLDQLHTHPLFDYRCSWRTIIKIQARLLARWLRGDIPAFTCPVVR